MNVSFQLVLIVSIGVAATVCSVSFSGNQGDLKSNLEGIDVELVPEIDGGEDRDLFKRGTRHGHLNRPKKRGKSHHRFRGRTVEGEATATETPEGGDTTEPTNADEGTAAEPEPVPPTADEGTAAEPEPAPPTADEGTAAEPEPAPPTEDEVTPAPTDEDGNTPGSVDDTTPYVYLIQPTEPPVVRNLEEEEKNKAIILNYFHELYAKFRIEIVDELFSPDFINHDPHFKSNDMEGFKSDKSYQIMGKIAADPTVEIDEPDVRFIAADGDKVWCYIRGKTPKQQVILEIYRLKDGMVTEMWRLDSENVDIAYDNDVALNDQPYF